MIVKIVDKCKNLPIMVTKATNQKGKPMADEKRGHSRSPDLKQYYIKTDPAFHRRLKAASALSGQDMTEFLRECAEIRICAIFAANGGNTGSEPETQT